jgi:hypothetical protein
MAVDFEKEVVQMMDAVNPAFEYTFAPETLELAVIQLERINDRYGPDSDTPLEYHDAPHSIAVPRRFVRLGNILFPYMKPAHQSRFFDGGIIVGTHHDDEQGLGPIENELASAAHTVRKIEEADGVLNTKAFKKRVTDGTEATAVRMDDNGKLIQINLRRGSHDPLKFNIAFADINGIAMEGEERMVLDATDLYHELTPVERQSDEGQVAFYESQVKFLRQRLNDGQIKGDIAYYFPDDVEAVYKAMRKEFHRNIRSAHGIALLLSQRPELSDSIKDALRRVDRSHAGSLVAKLIHHKLGKENR